jgi:hypothetical protein
VDAWRIGLATLATGLALGGCSPPPPPPPPPAPLVSYDGAYTGTVKLTGVGAGVPRVGCATSPQLMVQVQNNTFTYVQTHPKATVRAPGFATTNATASYTAAIAQDGSFSGQSQLAGTISGTIKAGHMTGNIEGLECVYTFTADRG